ncbi:MAG: hypothetical protein QOF33_1873 [Thermomicrobiales bacterium]|nr:hypothetical protein [Thermomicrobiales bacterium]
MTADRFGEVGQRLRGVEDSARLLKRLYLVERETMRALGAWHLSVADWDLKIAVPRDWWQDSLHADALRSRVLELRYPKRDVDSDHDPALVAFLETLTRAETDAEFALGIYAVVKPALVEAYRIYLAGGDSLNDAPSFHHISHILTDEQAQLDEIASVLAALPGEEHEAAQSWMSYLEVSLSSIGGLLGERPRSAAPSDHPCAGRPAYRIPERAARDPRFLPAVVESPLRRPRNAREQQVWYAIDHANEVWAAEVPGAMMWHFSEMPWQFYLDVARWGWDEMRHALMGKRRLDAWGFEMGVDYPMVGDPYHAILEKGGDLLDVMALLYYFERMAPPIKQRDKVRYDELGDVASAQDTDYDWADEAIHLRFGYTWLNHILGDEAKTRLQPLVARAGEMWETWLAERWERGEDGYGPYMKRIEARIAAAEAEAAGVPA